MKPLKLDVLKRQARELASGAVARDDGPQALEACRMHLALYDAGYVMFPYDAGYVMFPLAVDDGVKVPVDPNQAVAPRFGGRVLDARFPGRCAICRAPIIVGDPILLSATDRAVAHERCGR
jgi:hypothetical protein